MVSPYRRKRLIENIEATGPESFHWVCVNLLGFITQNIIHSSGVNLENKAVGYASDAVSINSKIVGEFSTEKGYFKWVKREIGEPQYEKAVSDIEHAIKLQNNVEQVYLLSSQSCSDGELRKLNDYLVEKFTSLSKITILNADKIADVIIEGLKDSEYFTNEIEKYLEEIRYMKVELYHNSTFPIRQKEYIRRSEEAKILEGLKRTKFVLVHGISGSGKTDLMKSVGNDVVEEFDYRIWIDGSALKNETSLASVKVAFLDIPVSIFENIKTHKTLLCIDSFEGNVSILKDLSGRPTHEKTKILVTSQINFSVDNYTKVSIGGVDKKTFESILNVDLEAGNKCPEKLLEELYAYTSGYVIVASLINHYIKERSVSWSQLGNIEKIVGKLDTEKNGNLVEFLISNYSQSLRDELDCLKYLNSKYIEPGILAKLITPIGVANLLKRSLIQLEVNGLYKIHDLIFHSIQKIDIKKDVQTKIEKEFIRALIRMHYKNEDVALFNISLLVHKNLILDIYKRVPEAHEMYLSLLAIESEELYEENYKLLSDFQSNKDQIAKNSSLVYALVEYSESYYRKLRYFLKQEYVSFLRQTVLNYNYLVINCESDEVRKYLFHHRGKAKNLLKDGSSKEDFLSALKIDSKFYEAMLQLFKTEASGSVSDDHNHLIESILDASCLESSTVSPNVTLAALQDLRRMQFNKTRNALLLKYKDVFKKTVLMSAINSNSHTYDAIFGIGYDFGLIDKELIREIYNLIEFPVPPESREEDRLRIGLALKTIGIILSNAEILKVATTYFENIDFKKVDVFIVSHVADCYIEAMDYSKALNILETTDPAKRKNFTALKFAKAYHGLKNKKQALEWINIGIETLSEKDHGKHMISFSSMKSLIEKLA